MSSKDIIPTNVKIQTFVFFDLETTDLIRGSNMPKIIEMSLVATSRDSLYNKNGGFPRVMHKLTVPIQPLRPIPLEVSEITGLYNDLLEAEKPFDRETYELFNSFIGRLHPPICFVAHNGIRFDYPILCSELNRIGEALSENILCVDSITAFRDFFGGIVSKACTDESVSQSANKNSAYFDDGCDAELAVVLDSIEAVSSARIENECFDETKMNQGMTRQQSNETTPTHKTTSSSNMNPCKQFKKKVGLAGKKRLPFTKGGPKNFKLVTVYEYLVGKTPFNSHSAEGDCLTLLCCAMKISDFFVDWADNNASPLVQYAKNNCKT